MKQYDNINPVNNLPDCYAKDENSNNYKLLFNEKVQLNTFAIDATSVLNSLDLENATGHTLDLYGEMLNQPRGLANDSQYKLLLRSKIMRNLSCGDYPSVIKAICMTFNCEPSEVLIIEKEDSPGAVEISVLPIGVINKAGLTANQTINMIEGLLPIGVNVESFLFEGTFEFSDIEAEFDELAGFSNDEQSIGGYFGIVSGEEDEIILPID